MCESVGHNAKTDLEGAVRLLFNVQDDCLDHNKSRPRVLWSLYFNMDTHTIKESNLLVGQWATNLYPTSNQDSTMTYEKAVQEVWYGGSIHSIIVLSRQRRFSEVYVLVNNSLNLLKILILHNIVCFVLNGKL